MVTRGEASSALTPEQLDELRTLLMDKRAAITARAARPHVDNARGDRPDMMDAATDATGDAEDIAMSERERHQLGEIDRALERMAEGVYGLSEESGEPIAFERLRLVPFARLTVQEAEVEEKLAR